MTSNELSSRLINIYNELSEYMGKLLNERDYKSHVQMLNILSKKHHMIKAYYDELRLIANLRNIIVHDSTSKYNPIAEPHKEIVDRYEYIFSRIKNPPIAIAIATKSKHLIFAKQETKVKTCIKRMHEKNISYMPIIKDDQLIGVLSGDCIFTYMRKNHTTTIHEEFTIGDLGDSIFYHIDERFSFVSKGTPLHQIVEMFANDIQDGKRLGAVFVTQSGSKKEKILGMISAWDVIDYIGDDLL